MKTYCIIFSNMDPGPKLFRSLDEARAWSRSKEFTSAPIAIAQLTIAEEIEPKACKDLQKFFSP